MLKKLLNSKFKKDLLFSYFSQAIVISFGFLQLLLINKYFGVEIFGQLMIIISIVGIFGALVSARSSEAVIKFVKIEQLKNKLENIKFIVLLGICIDIFTGLFLLMLVYFIAPLLSNIFIKEANINSEIYLYSFIIFFMFLRNSMVGFLQSNEIFDSTNILTMIDAIIKIVVLSYYIFIVQEFLLIDIVISFLVANIIATVYIVYIFYKQYFLKYINIKYKFNKILLKEYISFNIKTFLSSSLKAGGQNIDNLIIAYFLSPYIVGIYQTIKKILSPILIVATPFSMLVYPKLVYYFQERRKEQFFAILKKISGLILFFSLCYSLFVYIFLEEIFLFMNVVFKNEYIFYFLLVTIMITLIAMLWWSRIFSNTVNPNYSIYMSLFSVLFQLSITLLLTQKYSLIGMIISIVLMYGIIYLYYLNKLKGI